MFVSGLYSGSGFFVPKSVSQEFVRCLPVGPGLNIIEYYDLMYTILAVSYCRISLGFVKYDLSYFNYLSTFVFGLCAHVGYLHCLILASLCSRLLCVAYLRGCCFVTLSVGKAF